MARAFANISFTPNVKKVQSEMGSRDNYQSFELGEKEGTTLSNFEKQFITERDSFYQATTAENGWPYVQHRGGPKGVIKVLNDTTIGYADFSGNRQYLSVGNLLGDDRISLILMDYQHRQRLKIWGRARLISESMDPDLIAQLEPEDSRAPIERGVVITVEAFDWNCPKYITPRYTQDEVDTFINNIQSDWGNKPTVTYDYQGRGETALTITAVRQLADNIRSYEFSHNNGETLPKFDAGAHITVPVLLDDGRVTTRSYSLTHSFKANSKYEIAVKQDTQGKGASTAIHKHWQVGTQINIDAPKNYFGLHHDDRPTRLIAGGIGITPLKAMAETLSLRDADFELHYTGKSYKTMAYIDELSKRFARQCHFYYSTEPTGPLLNIESLLKSAPPTTVFFVCGPNRLIKGVLSSAQMLGIDRECIQFESFE